MQSTQAFDWSRAYGSKKEPVVTSNLQRSVKGLPSDLEYLLKKVDDDNLGEEEVRRLRLRLEEVENEMELLLRAMNPRISRNENNPVLTTTDPHEYESNSSGNSDGELFSLSDSDFEGKIEIS